MSIKSGNLIVNYLPQNMSDRELYSMFVTVGPVESCKVMKDFKVRSDVKFFIQFRLCNLIRFWSNALHYFWAMC